MNIAKNSGDEEDGDEAASGDEGDEGNSSEPFGAKWRSVEPFGG